MHAFLKTVNLKSTKVLARDRKDWNDREKYGYPKFVGARPG
jgi:hypothetical protein